MGSQTVFTIFFLYRFGKLRAVIGGGSFVKRFVLRTAFLLHDTFSCILHMLSATRQMLPPAAVGSET